MMVQPQETATEMEHRTKETDNYGSINKGFCHTDETQPVINTSALSAATTWNNNHSSTVLCNKYTESVEMNTFEQRLEEENKHNAYPQDTQSNTYIQDTQTLEVGRMFELPFMSKEFKNDSTPDIVICANCGENERKGHKLSESGLSESPSVSSRSTDSGVSLRRTLSLGDRPTPLDTSFQNSMKDGGMIWYSGSSCSAPNADGDDTNWRPSLESFTSKRLGSKRKNKAISKPLRSFYKSQDDLIEHYEKVRSNKDVLIDRRDDITALRKRASFYAKITFLANLVLLGIKVVAVVMSGSISLVSSLVDSSVDLMSGVVIYVTSRAVKRTDRYMYPQGRTKLEPMAIVILAVIMSVASLQVIKESITKSVGLGNGSTLPPSMDWLTVGISSATVVIKFILFMFCRRVQHPTVQALALDHRNDVVSNSAAILFGYIGSSEMQSQAGVWGLVFLDPFGAIVISIYIIVNWVITGWDQIKMLTGHTASPDFLSKVTWMCVDHHRHVQKVGNVRAFHYGNNFLVEVEIILPPEITLKEAHNISDPLQQKLESLPNVERAFVHLDYETSGE